MISISAFPWVPAFAQGHVRDLRIRWALEEAGLPYDVVLVDPATKRSDAYRAWQPFGQVPAFRDDGVTLFESGAIVLYLADRAPSLAPPDPAGRARASVWVLAALNSIEPFVQDLGQIDVFHAGETWTAERRPQVVAALDGRLAMLAGWLGARDYLEDSFTAGDLMMTTVLRDVSDPALLDRHRTLLAYRRRCEARPAFARALEAQMATFREHAPA